ncbi:MULTISPECIES: gamma-glutamylcyclotransferase family protein [Haloarcula]|uniref:gamma-glutamylcyclotransferase family protein n=1 Tax=Haloarcula TaxID=2237 RepID=UPI0023EB1A8E|nr:gamma-glutamylcyclotransferase family protein [Halomicroarcula sp. XH51]
MEVFVYGTLTDPATAASVLETYTYRGSATLAGLHRVDGRYPTLAPGGTADGRLLWTPEVTALDAYEGVDRGLYVRVSLPRADTTGQRVECYVGDPAALDAPVEWPGTGPFADRVRRVCRSEDVGVRAQE